MTSCSGISTSGTFASSIASISKLRNYGSASYPLIANVTVMRYSPALAFEVEPSSMIRLKSSSNFKKFLLVPNSTLNVTYSESCSLKKSLSESDQLDPA